MPKETRTYEGKTYKVVDKRPLGFYCIYCKTFITTSLDNAETKGILESLHTLRWLQRMELE